MASDKVPSNTRGHKSAAWTSFVFFLYSQTLSEINSICAVLEVIEQKCQIEKTPDGYFSIDYLIL